jgi:protein TonB
MYATAKKRTGSTSIAGLVTVVVINGVVGYALWNGLGGQIVEAITKTEVVVIEETVEIEEEPPPPPPPEVDLPPPPPQVVLPEFTFDVPPPPNAISQVQQVETPRPAAVRPPPPPAPPATPAVRPRVNERQMVEMLTEEYPPRSLRAKEEGVVGVSLCVSEQGRISDVKLVRSSGFPLLDDATVKNLPKVRMTPAKDSAGKNIPWCNPPFPLDVQWQIPER